MSSVVDGDGLPWEASFAGRMRVARERAGWSQRELARRLTERGLKFHPQQVQRLEEGSRPFRLNEAVLLAEVLGEPFDEMLALTGADAARVVVNAEIVEWQGDVLPFGVKALLEESMKNAGDSARMMGQAWSEYVRACRDDKLSVDAGLKAAYDFEVKTIGRLQAAIAKALAVLMVAEEDRA